MSVRRGDIVLIPFPFTDLTSSKIRPAVVISAEPQGNDIIIAFISSVVPESIGKTEYLLTSKSPDFTLTGLKKNSVFKMNKLLTISSALILRRLGRIGSATQKELNNCLKKALELA